PGVEFPRPLDLLHGTAARHAAGRRTVHTPLRRAARGVRQAPPSSAGLLHFRVRGRRRRSLKPTAVPCIEAGMTHYDVIIIGTGAGGGTLAYHLAPSGKRILLIERGDYVRREKDNWSSRAVNVDAKYHTKEIWKSQDGQPLHPHTNYYVGGNTKF